MKRLALIIGIMFLGLAAHSEDQSFKPLCLDTKDLQAVSEHFWQFRKLINSEGEQTCSEKKNHKWMVIAKALVTLYKNSAPLPEHRKDDPFTYQVIKTPDFWKYFTRRADRFDITPSRCGEGVGAWVWDRYPGEINICDSFYLFENDPGTLASLLLHEVRHFDDMSKFSHVRCSRDSDNYACDKSIEHRGAYAVSVQASAVFGLRGHGLNAKERALSRMDAISRATYHFVHPPQIKLTSSLLLQGAGDDVYQWFSESDQLIVRKTLDQPARVYPTGFNDLVFYPEDSNLPAYRQNMDFESSAVVLGFFADHYNQLTPQERSLFKDVSYSDDGALLIGDQLNASCDNKLKSQKDPLYSQMDGFVSVDDVTYLKHVSGVLYKINCPKRTKQPFTLKATDLKISPEIKRTFQLSGEDYALTHQGQILKDMLAVDSPSLNSQAWRTAAPFTVPSLFLQDDISGLWAEQ